MFRDKWSEQIAKQTLCHNYHMLNFGKEQAAVFFNLDFYIFFPTISLKHFSKEIDRDYYLDSFACQTVV